MEQELEIMCDVIDYAMGAVLGQRTEKILRTIYYGNKTFMRHKKTTQLHKRRC